MLTTTQVPILILNLDILLHPILNLKTLISEWQKNLCNIIKHSKIFEFLNLR